MVRSIEAESSREVANEVAHLLSSATGSVFFSYNAFGYRELADKIANGDLGFAWMPPVLALDLAGLGETLLAVPVRRGSITYNAALVTARARGPKSIAELKGKTVAWVDRESTSGYLVPRELIALAGFDPRTLFSEELFVHGHDNVVDAVVSGRAAVGATFVSLDPVTKQVAQAGWTDAEGKNAKDVEILAMTGAIPNDVLVMSKTVPEELGPRVLACLNEEDAFRRLLRAEGFLRPSAEHLEPLRKTLHAARARGEAPPSVRRIA